MVSLEEVATLTDRVAMLLDASFNLVQRPVLDELRLDADAPLRQRLERVAVGTDKDKTDRVSHITDVGVDKASRVELWQTDRQPCVYRS